MRILLLMQKRFISSVNYEEITHRFFDQGGNIGNKVFLNATYNYLDKEYNTIDFCEFDQSNGIRVSGYEKEYINENFDAIVIPTVQVGINTIAIQVIKAYTDFIDGIKIPVICFSVGAQTENYAELEALCQYTKDVFLRFADNVIKSGGKFALRGSFTKEYFDRLGIDKKSAEVVGCQSMYQGGRDLHIEKKCVSQNEFIPIMNGNDQFLCRRDVSEILKNNPNILFFDQDMYVDLLYGKDILFDELNYRQFIRYVRKYGISGLEMFSENRIKLIADFCAWKQYIVDIHANFSFGERIHGNIISLLAGVPACVCYCDTRTQEMAEFFDIPNIDSKRIKGLNLYDFYCSLDYKLFNANYVKKYDQFYDFLTRLGLVRKERRTVEKSESLNIQKFEEYINLGNEERLLKCKYMNKLPYKICNYIIGRRG